MSFFRRRSGELGIDVRQPEVIEVPNIIRG
jgi:hypothetical protein